MGCLSLSWAKAQSDSKTPILDKKNAILKELNKTSKNKILETRIKQAIKTSGVPVSNLSILVADTNTILFQLNAEKSFNPASLTKIFTASALLDLLPPSLKFKTKFLSDHPVNNSTLKGNLYLKGGGDPSFVSESLWNLVNNLSRTGVRTIEGQLILDDSRFDSKKKSTRLKTNSRAPYNAPVGALSFNWNTANIYVRPEKQPGQSVHLHIDPSPLYFSTIQNKTTTTKQSRKSKLDISIQKNKNLGRESLTLRGSMSFSEKEDLIYKNISYPALWTGWNTIAFLKQRGIIFKNSGNKKVTPNTTHTLAKWKNKINKDRINKGVTPTTAHGVAQWEGKTLSENVRLMMKYSSNFMVDMLVKNLAVEKGKTPGSLNEGLKIIKQHINHQLGIPNKEYQLEEASGLSRKNRFRAMHLLKAFRYWENHSLQPEFESSFAIAGQDGTLKKRFKTTLQAKMYAKTGSLNGVAGLAGFFKTPQGKKIFFILLFNGSKQQQAKAELLLDSLTTLIFQIHQ